MTKYHFSKSLVPFAAAAMAAGFGTACGGSDDKDDPPPAVVSANLTLADSKATTDNGTFALTSIDVCSRNVESGRVDVTISQGANTPALTFGIKNYSSTPQTYTCTQEVDNRESATDLGGKFAGCMVDVKVLSEIGQTTLHGYSMYREVVAVQPFTYAGTCKITLTEATPTITGTVSCVDMVQTYLKVGPRNPIGPGVTADVTADFKCAFR